MSVSWKGGGQSDIIMLGMGKTILNLNIFVILRPSVGFGILQCSGLVLPHRMEFYAEKQCYLNQHFHILLLLHFFIPERSVVLFSALAIFYFISFTYYMTHSEQNKAE